MPVTDAQVRKLMEEMSKHGKVGLASMKAGMDRKTGRKYVEAGQLPSELKKGPRTYRTREDPFAEDWKEVREMLKAAPALEAKALFEWLMGERPGKYEPGQLRTFQRKVKEWRATEGPDKEVYFAQEHVAGEAMQIDGTWARDLGVTINGERFEHMLYHVVLPYSNWEWATVTRSESLMAIRRGVQQALFRLGRVPKYCQSDNSSAATHELAREEKRGGGRKRGFNNGYEEFVRHFGMEPRTIGVGQSHQNGDVESSNGGLKGRLKQHLLLRGSADFESVEAYEGWVQDVCAQTNALRSRKVSEELAAMKELSVARLREHTELRVRVSRESTIRVKHNTYSVPSRLAGEKVDVRVYEDRLEVFYGGKVQVTMERLLGRNKHRINYRHVIWSLVRKPGAFRRYRYREEMFPGMVFRRAYDAINKAMGHGYKADLEYLRILHCAAAVSESDVEVALELILSEGHSPTYDKVQELVDPREPELPEMEPYTPDLGEYDELVTMSEVVL